jgi:hypothetical protein
MAQIDNHEIDIDSAHQKLKDTNFKFDWKSSLTKASELINDIPGSSFADNPDEVIQRLDAISERIVKLKAMASAVIEKGKI